MPRDSTTLTFVIVGEEVKVGLTSRLAQDVMACKKGAPGLLKLLELDR